MKFGDPVMVEIPLSKVSQYTVLLIRSPRPWRDLFWALGDSRTWRAAWSAWRARRAFLQAHPECDWRWLRMEKRG